LLFASADEFVEVVTIVLAIDLIRGWRAALAGSAASVSELQVVI
jgi:uncharacterized membrane protein